MQRSGFLKSRHARILTVALALQAVGLYAVSRQESAPDTRPLEQFPSRLGSWSMIQQGVVEAEVMEVLRADDVVTRVYADERSGRAASLFVAFFKSQRAGQAPHSPKNCLPGSGWVPSDSGVISIPVDGRAAPVSVNRYVVAKGEEKSVVLYWYQSHNRVIASEYRAKIYQVLDAIRYNRTDTALIRVVSPVVGRDEEAATAAAVEFVQSFFGPLRTYLPS